MINQMKINISELVPKEWNIKQIGKNYLKISFLREGRGNQARPFILPREIAINEELVSAVAMYIGDGKTSNDAYHLDYT